MDIRRKGIIKSSVRHSIERLLDAARKAYGLQQPNRAKRYVQMAADLLKKHKTKIPKEMKNSFCRKCHLIWIPEKTIKVTYDKKNACLRVSCSCGYSKRV